MQRWESRANADNQITTIPRIVFDGDGNPTNYVAGENQSSATLAFNFDDRIAALTKAYLPPVDKRRRVAR